MALTLLGRASFMCRALGAEMSAGDRGGVAVLSPAASSASSAPQHPQPHSSVQLHPHRCSPRTKTCAYWQLESPSDRSHCCLGWRKTTAITKLPFQNFLPLAAGQVMAQRPLECVYVPSCWPPGTNYPPLLSRALSQPQQWIILLIFISFGLSVPCL